MKLIIYQVNHVNLQVAYADNVSQIENLKAINTIKYTHLTPLFCVIYAII